MALDMAAVLPLRRASTMRNLRTEDSSEVVLSAEAGRVLHRDKEVLLAPPGSRDGSRLRDILAELWLLSDCCLAGEEPKTRGEARAET